MDSPILWIFFLRSMDWRERWNNVVFFVPLDLTFLSSGLYLVKRQTTTMTRALERLPVRTYVRRSPAYSRTLPTNSLVEFLREKRVN